MIDIKIKNWDKTRVKAIMKAWGVKGDKALSVTALQKLFSKPDKIASVLTELTPSETDVLNVLLHEEETALRSTLVTELDLEKDEIDEVVQSLVQKGLVTVMKNRARLDDSIDRLYPNKYMTEVIAKKSLLVEEEKVKKNLRLTLNEDLVPDLDTYFTFCYGRIPKEICKGEPLKLKSTDMRKLSEGLAYLDHKFVPVKRKNVLQEYDDAMSRSRDESGTADYSGLFIMSAFCYHLQKRKLHMKNGEQFSKRDIDLFEKKYGIPGSNSAEVIQWMVDNEWIVCRESRGTVSEMAINWIKQDFEGKVEFLQEMYSQLLPGKHLKLEQLYNKYFERAKLAKIEHYQDVLAKIQELIRSIRILWRLGLVRVYKKDDRVISVKKNSGIFASAPEKGAIVVSANMELHIYAGKLPPWAYYYLSVFTDRQDDGKVHKAVISEKSIIRGITMGLSAERFVNMLEECSKKKLPQNVVFTINDWISSVSEVQIEHTIVMSAPPAVIDLIEHDRVLQKYVVQRLNEEKVELNLFDEREMFTHLEKLHILMNYEKDENTFEE